MWDTYKDAIRKTAFGKRLEPKPVYKKTIEIDQLTTHQLRILLGLFSYDDLWNMANSLGVLVGISRAGTILRLTKHREKLAHKIFKVEMI